MKIALVGSRYFGAAAFEALRKEEGVEFSSVVVPAADDRLAHRRRARPAFRSTCSRIRRWCRASAVPEGTDLVVAAHTHARVSDEALAHSRLGGIGYHPSLLPRHRGIAAVEWTIQEGDPIAGGTVYHLADGWDAGAIAAQEWCFVGKGETARELVGARLGADRPRAPPEGRAATRSSTTSVPAQARRIRDSRPRRR